MSIEFCNNCLKKEKKIKKILENVCKRCGNRKTNFDNELWSNFFSIEEKYSKLLTKFEVKILMILI
jgi:hypothetical protein